MGLDFLYNTEKKTAAYVKRLRLNVNIIRVCTYNVGDHSRCKAYRSANWR